MASRAVLITGCSTGIGRATALRLARGGWPVYASARRLDSIRDLERQGCGTLALDVTDEASMVAAVEAVKAAHGAVGALVNNAGYSQSGAVEEVPLEEARRQFETNFFGALRLAQLALPGMRAQGWGRIVNVSSMGGRLVFPGGGFYHASKFALEAISDALRFEVRPFGVAVVLVEPGLIKTEFATAAAGSMEPVGSPDSPYRAFNESVARAITGAYQMPLATSPDAVARVIERALKARRPRTRYPVTIHARAALVARRLLPDRLWDAAMNVQFEAPARRN